MTETHFDGYLFDDGRAETSRRSIPADVTFFEMR